MNESPNYRSHFAECLKVFADPKAQLRYEADVPFVRVPIEIIETFYDLYFPQDRDFIAQFSDEERSGLAELDGLLVAARDSFARAGVHSVTDLLKLPQWQKVMVKAETLRQFFRNV